MQINSGGLVNWHERGSKLYVCCLLWFQYQHITNLGQKDSLFAISLSSGRRLDFSKSCFGIFSVSLLFFWNLSTDYQCSWWVTSSCWIQTEVPSALKRNLCKNSLLSPVLCQMWLPALSYELAGQECLMDSLDGCCLSSPSTRCWTSCSLLPFTLRSVPFLVHSIISIQ